MAFGAVAALALLFPILLSGCSVTGNEDSMYARLRNGDVVEAFDTQAVPALEAGLAECWYPQHLATAVIAVDRGRTDTAISGWQDLLSAGVDVGFDDAGVNSQLLLAAMAYGLEGENFTMRGTVKLLADLRTKGLLAFGSFDAPIVVCFNTHVPEAMEIVVPEEGTFTYVRGLLSNHPLELKCDVDLTTYENASFVTDYDHLNTVCRDSIRVLRRSVLRTRLYSSADAGEHQLFALLLLILVVVWAATVIRRAMQKDVRRASLLIGILLLGWIMVRLLKYQMPFTGTLNRYFWYGFYLFVLALPLVLLWLAWSIDQPEDRLKPPKWFAVPAAAGVLVTLVFTNDLHNWVFRLDLSNPNWASEYGYGPVFYVVTAFWALFTLAALAIMMLRVRRNPRKWSILFPVGFFVLLMAYLVAYAMRIPLARESDLTMTAGIFILLSLETSIRAGMIPVNTKYKLLFTHSPLAMRIHDSADNIALSSASEPLRRDDDTLLFTAPIAGGRVLWQEDITALNRLHREVEEHTRRLQTANAILAEEEGIRRAVEEEKARLLILSQLEAEIAGHTARLSGMIERQDRAARIALLICYIKRRCNLFFRDREAQSISVDELTVYMDELAEFAGYAGLWIVSASEMKTPIGLRRAALFYDVFYSVTDWAVSRIKDQETSERHMLASLCREDGMLIMRLQCPKDVRPFQVENNLADAIAFAGGAIEVKDLGDAVGINLSFPEGGAEVG